MKVKVILDGLFTKKNGLPASNNMDYDFFARYLSAFDTVEVVARCFDVEEESAKVVEGNNINFTALPGYQGPKGLLMNCFSVFKAIFKAAFDNQSIVILRLPATIPSLVGFLRIITNKPYAVELVGDPNDAYSPESLQHPLSRMFQSIFYHGTKVLCKKASACSYVTEHTLQKKYPNQNMYSFTSLCLDESFFMKKGRLYETPLLKPKLIMVAMMQNYYKGHDIFIESIRILVHEYSFDGKIVLVGDGPLRPELEELVIKNKLNNYIQFYGKSQAGKETFDLMDSSDLLVLPSRQEGLPRVVIEAMARGLPCLCTNVGGTAELVGGEQLLEVPLTADKLANQLNKLIVNYKDLQRYSEVNLETSGEYEASKVQKKRLDFYSKLVELSIK